MKRIILILLTVFLLSVPAFADGEARVVIGADLTEEQIAAVYADFGINRGDVKELQITHELELKYLEGTVSNDIIGTKSISSVYVEYTDDGISVDLKNINWCSEGMYIGAMATAGIENAKVSVTAPFEVSGTAALAGIYIAYEDMMGEDLSGEAKDAGLLELVSTAMLSSDIGGSEALTLVTELKLILNETKDMSDEELLSRISEIAKDYKIELTDYHKEILRDLARGLEKLNPDDLRETVEGVKDTLQKMGEFKDKAVSFWDALMNFFRAIGEFFSKIMGIFAS